MVPTTISAIAYHSEGKKARGLFDGGMGVDAPAHKEMGLRQPKLGNLPKEGS